MRCNVSESGQAAAAPSSSPRRISALIAATASGPLPAIRFAIASASSRTWSAGTTRFTSPAASARGASMLSPVRHISSAIAGGTRLPSTVPPPPGINPRLTSDNPKKACSAATTTSHDIMSSKPPATAAPLIAPISGTPRSQGMTGAITCPAIPSAAEPSDDASPCATKPLRSIPAQNARSPAPVSTTARTASSSTAAASVPLSASMSSGSSALRASGRFIVRTDTVPDALDEEHLRAGSRVHRHRARP